MTQRPEPREVVTALLLEWRQGDKAAFDRLVPVVYEELRRVARAHLRGERAHSLQTTALVHEAYLRLVDLDRMTIHSRTHFFAVAARVVRAVLVDHARARRAVKRGSGAESVELTLISASVAQTPVDVLDLDAALQALEAMDPEQVRIVELRYFAGLSIEETAEAIGASPSSVKRGWLAAKTYIRRHLDGDIARS